MPQKLFKAVNLLKKPLWIKVLIIFVFVIGLLFWYFSIIYRFDSLKPQSLTNLPPHMILAHRGYTQGYAENSLESFDAAQRMGYYGIELDVHFLESKGLVVAHDIPKNNFTNQNYLLIETVFKRYKNQFYYWLDFKNLTNYNAQVSGELLSRYIKLYRLNGHIFVESTNANALYKLKKIAPDINTIYWLPSNLHIKHVLFSAKYQTLRAGADMVSIPEQYATDLFFENFSHLNISIFTVNNPERVDYFFKKGAYIILSDIDMRTVFPKTYRFMKGHQ